MTSKEFETFFRENYVRALRHAAAVLHDEEGARDVVADAFERIYTLCSSGRCPDNHAAYLMTTVHHLSVDYLRQKNRQTAYAKLFLAAHIDLSVSENPLEHERKMASIMEAVNLLTPRTQQVLKACYVERKKYKEVAEELNISKSAVKKHIMNALKTLREIFRNDDF